MGMYAQSNIEITCKDNATAKKVAKKIEEARADNQNKDDLNYEFSDLEVGDEMVYLFKSSGRYQNLEYQCEQLWELIKGIKGVVEMNCPFLSEADGQWFSNEN